MGLFPSAATISAMSQVLKVIWKRSLILIIKVKLFGGQYVLVTYILAWN